MQSVDKYEVKKEIRSGGMGVIYLAEDMFLKTEHALKIINDNIAQRPKFKEFFLQEAQIQASLVHDNIVRVTNFFIDQNSGKCCIIMDFIDGEDLDDFLHRKNQLSEKEVLELLRGILAGIGYAHRLGIVHRDIKSSNIMVSRLENKLHANIMDFGLAAKVDGENVIKACTPEYASPEQIDNKENVDKRADIYAIGIVLYEMLTGTLPFDGEKEEVERKQKQDTPPNITSICPHISKRTADAVARCLEKNPHDRFQDCDEFLAYLESSKPPRVSKHSVAVVVLAVCLAFFVFW